MKYPYKMIKDPGWSTFMELPDHVWHFGAFISELNDIEIADRVLKYVDDVLSGSEDEIECMSNAPTVIIRPKISQAYNEFARNPDEIQEMETEEFRKLIVIWKENLIEEREERRRKKDS